MGGHGELREALGNMTYPSEWTRSGQAPLVGGVYEEPAASGLGLQYRDQVGRLRGGRHDRRTDSGGARDRERIRAAVGYFSTCISCRQQDNR